jgi:hypothetical protein
MVVDNEIQLIFKVPILDEKQLLHFYRVLPIPIFSNDTTSGNITTLVPELNAECIGISKSGTSYIIVSSGEFSQCTTTPHLCQISSPILAMNKAAHCIRHRSNWHCQRSVRTCGGKTAQVVENSSNVCRHFKQPRNSTQIGGRFGLLASRRQPFQPGRFFATGL